ncbi:hypothetical protein [Enterocloster bolteae]|jgi:hypothetical protein|uniref:hypothetical protein n=1 Tax=Enterocloster bolteae TaxID=208479 RepID=UPI001898ECB6|nr:hypothetical protein [Enterocloster bolteae]
MFGEIGMESVRVMEVIEIMALKGDGTEKDPVRKITQYWDMKGNFLAEYDPHLKELRDKKIVEAFNVETCKFDESLFDSPKEEPDSNDTPEMEELIEKIKSGEKIPISIQTRKKAPELKLCKAVSRERKRNHLTITIEAEEPEEAKVLFKNLRKAIRKENRLLLGNISYEVDCKVRK